MFNRDSKCEDSLDTRFPFLYTPSTPKRVLINRCVYSRQMMIQVCHEDELLLVLKG